eukprot:2459002-Alexandrium_andersonii.AAC.1
MPLARRASTRGSMLTIGGRPSPATSAPPPRRGYPQSSSSTPTPGLAVAHPGQWAVMPRRSRTVAASPSTA